MDSVYQCYRPFFGLALDTKLFYTGGELNVFPCRFKVMVSGKYLIREDWNSNYTPFIFTRRIFLVECNEQLLANRSTACHDYNESRRLQYSYSLTQHVVFIKLCECFWNYFPIFDHHTGCAKHFHEKQLLIFRNYKQHCVVAWS